MIASLIALAAALEVGPGKRFARIEDAVKAAQKGDEVRVYPDPTGYLGTAIQLKVPITIRGIDDLKPVVVKGDGFDYSGVGSVPRAIIQVEPSGSGAKIENLDLSGAHNQSFNGAGIRIQAANNVTIYNCLIHDNDMGLMSNGKDGDPQAGSNQAIEFCEISKNGNAKDPGYNHNLYLGGTSVRVSNCIVSNSTTGHNIKSRAHFTLIEFCLILESANREIDLPESWNTERPNSNVVLLGNDIRKGLGCKGNRGVIHFGQEKGRRNGNLYLLRNHIWTPFASPVVLITSSDSTVFASRNGVENPSMQKKALFEAQASSKFVGEENRTSLCYGSIPGRGNVSLGNSITLADLFPEKITKKDDAQYHEFLGKETWIDGEGKRVQTGFGVSYSIHGYIPSVRK